MTAATEVGTAVVSKAGMAATGKVGMVTGKVAMTAAVKGALRPEIRAGRRSHRWPATGETRTAAEMWPAATTEAGGGQVTASDVHTAATNVHAASDMRCCAAEMGASSEMTAAADMSCSSPTTPTASLRRRCGGAAGQNRH
jgi:hypothetical protein